MILQTEFFVKFEIGLNYAADDGDVLSIVSSLLLCFGPEHASEQHLAGNQVSQDQPLLSLRPHVDLGKALLSLLQILVDERVLALLEEVVVDVERSHFAVDLGRVEDALDLLVVVEGEEDGDLHDIDQRQVLSFDFVDEGTS